MQAQELYVKKTQVGLFDAGFKPAGVWLCARCRLLHRNEEGAWQCCGIGPCQIEGCDQDSIKVYVRYCVKHNAEREAKHQQDLFDKAKVRVHCTEYADPVYERNGTGGDLDGYYDSVEELIDYFMDEDPYWDGEDEDFTPKNTPDWCFGTKLLEFKLSPEHWIESALRDHHEDAADDLQDVNELYKFVDDWALSQGIISFEQDHNVIVMLGPKESYPEGTFRNEGTK